MRQPVVEDPLIAAKLTDPRTYRFWYGDRVQPADVDTRGRVGGRAIAVYFESARAAMFEEARLLEDGGPVSTAVASIAIDHRAELLFPADIRIGSRILDLEPMSVRYLQAIFSDGACIATADTVSILMDERLRRTAPLTEAQRARLSLFS